MRMKDYAPDLACVDVPVSDMTESMLFYAELGFDAAGTGLDPASGSALIFLRLGGLTLALREQEDGGEAPADSVSFSIMVDNIQGACDLVHSRGLAGPGAEIRTISFMDQDAEFFTIEGPSGERIGFVSFSV